MAKTSRRSRSRRDRDKPSSEKDSMGEDDGTFEAPTVGYQDAIYTHGTTKATAGFGRVTIRLRRYVALQSWKGATVAGQAMENLSEPIFDEPNRPSDKVMGDTKQILKDELGVEWPDQFVQGMIRRIKSSTRWSSSST